MTMTWRPARLGMSFKELGKLYIFSEDDATILRPWGGAKAESRYKSEESPEWAISFLQSLLSGCTCYSSANATAIAELHDSERLLTLKMRLRSCSCRFRPDGTGEKQWMLISSWNVPKTGDWLHGLHSFSENYGGSNGHLRRKALFSNQWILTDIGRWIEATTTSFSGSTVSWVSRTASSFCRTAALFPISPNTARSLCGRQQTVRRKRNFPRCLQNDSRSRNSHLNPSELQFSPTSTVARSGTRQVRPFQPR